MRLRKLSSLLLLFSMTSEFSAFLFAMVTTATLSFSGSGGSTQAGHARVRASLSDSKSEYLLMTPCP